MFSQGWLLRDIKPENILVAKRGLLFADLGQAVKPEESDAPPKVGGTESYWHPLSLYVENAHATQATDKYALGMCIWSIRVTMRFPGRVPPRPFPVAYIKSMRFPVWVYENHILSQLHHSSQLHGISSHNYMGHFGQKASRQGT